jgi:hypothetical protein
MMKFSVVTTLNQVVSTRNVHRSSYDTIDHSTGADAHAELAMCFYLRRSQIGT